MSYLGRDRSNHTTYTVKIDTIAASFNGATTAFSLASGGATVVPGSARNLIVAIDGVIQEPDVAYTVSGNTITFTEAPATGSDFWAVLNVHFTDLPASVIATGSFEKARQHAQTAYEDEANLFSQNQQINKTRPELQLLTSGTAKFRVIQHTPGGGVIAQNLSYDGTNWNLDDTTLPGMLLSINPDVNGIVLFTTLAGANPRTLTENLRFPFAGGIKFPATQIASADVNTLDDYEEGTWTPTITGTTSGSATTAGTISGTYTKIGRDVFFTLYNQSGLTNNALTGEWRISLPFTSENTTVPGGGFLTQYRLFPTFPANARGLIFGIPNNVAAGRFLYTYDNGTETSPVSGTPQASTEFAVVGHYRTP